MYIVGSKIGEEQRCNSPWQNDYNKYGEESFELYLIEDNIPDDIHFEREKYWIREYKSYDEKYGYNIRCKAPKTYHYLIQEPPKPFTNEDGVDNGKGVS